MLTPIVLGISRNPQHIAPIAWYHHIKTGLVLALMCPGYTLGNSIRVFVAKHVLYNVVNPVINHIPNRHFHGLYIYISVIYQPSPVMVGLWHLVNPTLCSILIWLMWSLGRIPCALMCEDRHGNTTGIKLQFSREVCIALEHIYIYIIIYTIYTIHYVW